MQTAMYTVFCLNIHSRVRSDEDVITKQEKGSFVLSVHVHKKQEIQVVCVQFVVGGHVHNVQPNVFTIYLSWLKLIVVRDVSALR